MQIIIPDFNELHNAPGVYKIVFDNKWFYIGSSQHLRMRFRRWVCTLNNIKYLKNKNMKVILPLVKEVHINVLCFEETKELALKKENKYLKKYKESIYLLNRCPQADTNKGVKPYFGQRLKKKKETNPKEFYYKPTAKFDKQGNLIEKYDTVKALAESVGMCHRHICRYLTGKLTHKQFIFKYINKEGSFEDHEPKQPRKYKKGKLFYQMDLEGNILAEYTRKQDAASAIGAMLYQVHAVLSKKPHYHTAKGFVFKYADEIAS